MPEEIDKVNRVTLKTGIEEFVIFLVSKIDASRIRSLRVAVARW